jgi:hypothetical protein
VDLELLAALRTPDGSAALATAAEMAGADPLAAASALRARGIAPALAAAALSEAELRRRALGKFGSAAESDRTRWPRPVPASMCTRWTPTR